MQRQPQNTASNMEHCAEKLIFIWALLRNRGAGIMGYSKEGEDMKNRSTEV